MQTHSLICSGKHTAPRAPKALLLNSVDNKLKALVELPCLSSALACHVSPQSF